MDGRRLRAFVQNLLTTPDDSEWVGFLGDAFRAYNSNMKLPALPVTAVQPVAAVGLR